METTVKTVREKDTEYTTDYHVGFYSDKVICIGDKEYLLYPYRWDNKLGCWNECSNLYSVSYIRRLEKAGKVIYR